MSERSERIDDAAFGVIYGAITAMGVLAATDSPLVDPLATGLTLFTTVFAVALAKAYADLASQVLKSGAHLSGEAVRAVWSHSRTILLAANGPALAMLLGAFGLYSDAAAFRLAQICAIGVLLIYGFRIGWRISQRLVPSVLSALGMGAVGLALTALKHLFH